MPVEASAQSYYSTPLSMEMGALSLSTSRQFSEEEIESPIKMLDPKFIAELEKHLGQKEANANMNKNAVLPSSSNSVRNCSLPSRSSGSIIPALRPPPGKLSQKNSPVSSDKIYNLPMASPLPASWSDKVRNSLYSKTVNLNSSAVCGNVSSKLIPSTDHYGTLLNVAGPPDLLQFGRMCSSDSDRTSACDDTIDSCTVQKLQFSMPQTSGGCEVLPTPKVSEKQVSELNTEKL